MPKFLNYTDAGKLGGVSRQAIQQAYDKGQLRNALPDAPKPAFDPADVIAWSERVRETGGPKKEFGATITVDVTETMKAHLQAEAAHCKMTLAAYVREKLAM